MSSIVACQCQRLREGIARRLVTSPHNGRHHLAQPDINHVRRECSCSSIADGKSKKIQVQAGPVSKKCFFDLRCLPKLLLWPLEKQQELKLASPMNARIAPKPSQHRQDQTRAPKFLRCDVLELPCQLQAAAAMEARAAEQAPKPLQGAQRKKPTHQILRAKAQTHIQRRSEKKEVEARIEIKAQENVTLRPTQKS